MAECMSEHCATDRRKSCQNTGPTEKGRIVVALCGTVADAEALQVATSFRREALATAQVLHAAMQF